MISFQGLAGCIPGQEVDNQRYEARSGRRDERRDFQSGGSTRNSRRQSRSPFSGREKYVWTSPGGRERSLSRRDIKIRGADGKVRSRKLSATPPPPKIARCKICSRQHQVGSCNIKPEEPRGRGEVSMSIFPTASVNALEVNALDAIRAKRSGNC